MIIRGFLAMPFPSCNGVLASAYGDCFEFQVASLGWIAHLGICVVLFGESLGLTRQTMQAGDKFLQMCFRHICAQRVRREYIPRSPKDRKDGEANHLARDHRHY